VSFSFGRRSYADSRARLTEDRRMHSSRRGGVSSSRASTVPGMVLQCLGWWHSGGDGRTGPEVAEVTHSTSLTSQRRPERVRGRQPYPFRGFHCPLSRGVTWWRYRSGRHSVTELTLAFLYSSRTVPGMAAQGGLVEWRRDMIPRRCQRAGVVGICL
jgi:hypothetical protein